MKAIDSKPLILPFSPHRLINLADMIKLFLNDFLIRRLALENSQLGARAHVLEGGLGHEADDAFKSLLLERLDKLRQYLIQLDLTVSLDHIGRLDALLTGYPWKETCSWEI